MLNHEYLLIGEMVILIKLSHHKQILCGKLSRVLRQLMLC